MSFDITLHSRGQTYSVPADSANVADDLKVYDPVATHFCPPWEPVSASVIAYLQDLQKTFTAGPWAEAIAKWAARYPDHQIAEVSVGGRAFPLTYAVMHTVYHGGELRDEYDIVLDDSGNIRFT